jgi:hypothetical protein
LTAPPGPYHNAIFFEEKNIIAGENITLQNPERQEIKKTGPGDKSGRKPPEP